MRHVANGQVVAECFQLLWQVDPTPYPSPLSKPVSLRPWRVNIHTGTYTELPKCSVNFEFSKAGQVMLLSIELPKCSMNFEFSQAGQVMLLSTELPKCSVNFKFSKAEQVILLSTELPKCSVNLSSARKDRWYQLSPKLQWPPTDQKTVNDRSRSSWVCDWFI